MRAARARRLAVELDQNLSGSTTAPDSKWMAETMPGTSLLMPTPLTDADRSDRRDRSAPRLLLRDRRSHASGGGPAFCICLPMAMSEEI